MNEFDPSKHLQTHREDLEGVTIFHLVGDCDMHTAPYVRLDVSPVLTAGQPVVIDLSEVAFMDSAGYGMLVGLTKIATDHNTPLAVCVKPQGIVLTGLRVLQVEQVLFVGTDMQQAIQHVTAGWQTTASPRAG
jgi:anti-anti-sigma factor